MMKARFSPIISGASILAIAGFSLSPVFSPVAFAGEQTTTRTGPYGNQQTTQRTWSSGQQTTTRTGPYGNQQTTDRTWGNGQQTTTRTGPYGNQQTTTRSLER
jgi:hypothetical protein